MLLLNSNKINELKTLNSVFTHTSKIFLNQLTCSAFSFANHCCKLIFFEYLVDVLEHFRQVSPCLYWKEHQRSKETWEFFLWKLCCWKWKEGWKSPWIYRPIRRKGKLSNDSTSLMLWFIKLLLRRFLIFIKNNTSDLCNHLILVKVFSWGEILVEVDIDDPQRSAFI